MVLNRPSQCMCIIRFSKSCNSPYRSLGYLNICNTGSKHLHTAFKDNMHDFFFVVFNYFLLMSAKKLHILGITLNTWRRDSIDFSPYKKMSGRIVLFWEIMICLIFLLHFCWFQIIENVVFTERAHWSKPAQISGQKCWENISKFNRSYRLLIATLIQLILFV